MWRYIIFIHNLTLQGELLKRVALCARSISRHRWPARFRQLDMLCLQHTPPTHTRCWSSLSKKKDTRNMLSNGKISVYYGTSTLVSVSSFSVTCETRHQNSRSISKKKRSKKPRHLVEGLGLINWIKRRAINNNDYYNYDVIVLLYWQKRGHSRVRIA